MEGRRKREGGIKKSGMLRKKRETEIWEKEEKKWDEGGKRGKREEWTKMRKWET